MFGAGAGHSPVDGLQYIDWTLQRAHKSDQDLYRSKANAYNGSNIAATPLLSARATLAAFSIVLLVFVLQCCHRYRFDQGRQKLVITF